MTTFGHIPGDIPAVMPVEWIRAITEAETELRGDRINSLSDWMPAFAGMTLDRTVTVNTGKVLERIVSVNAGMVIDRTVMMNAGITLERKMSMKTRAQRGRYGE
jgi:hypothetical protein